MVTITATVGKRGVNRSTDVKVVQRLLNQHNLPPLRRIDVDGIVGEATISAICHFQEVKMGLKNPDGRVDPDGRTIRMLVSGSNQNTIHETKNTIDKQVERQALRKNRQEFVRPQVRELRITTGIIDAILPYFDGVRAVVISGYLNDSDLFWKVNYHWELLVWMVDHAHTLNISEKHKRELRAIRSSLMAYKPDPEVGYRKSPTLGKPEDRSPLKQVEARYKTLQQCKKSFKRIVDTAKLKRISNRSSHTFDLAVAPVAHPGKSKHGTGYALDIQGDNARIKTICKRLGASLVFDEKSHIHVEFKKGVSGAR